MGFYGNITNTSRTQFQFDRIYMNRKQMDDSAASDGIYAGRYVLVNYEENGGSDYYISAYKSITTVVDPLTDQTSEKVLLGSSVNAEGILRFKWVASQSQADPDNDVLYEGQIVTVLPDHEHNLVNPNATRQEFWKVNGYETIDGINYALFPIEYQDQYSSNYNIDIDAYGTSRGYDSTVWQKVYQGGVDKYVMIAELNTVVPTFDIEADAPRMVPLTPHFDADSTNVYYKLHWSPSWGFRVKSAGSNLQVPILNDSGTSSGVLTPARTDQKDYPSDETTTWIKDEYTRVGNSNNYQINRFVLAVDEQQSTGQWISENEATNIVGPKAAIYYNKAGFDPAIVSYGFLPVSFASAEDYKPYVYYKKVNGNFKIADDLNYDSNEVYYEKIEDHITVESTGRSGHMYNKHDGSITDSVQEDTQELSIMLPAIGNTIAAVWDLIYGGEEVNGGNKRNLDVSWERARAGLDRHGLRMITDIDFGNQYLYQPTGVNTVAGAINSMHDLLGMIITSASRADLDEKINSLDENRIYYDENNHTFNRKRKMYRYTPINIENYTTAEVDDDNYIPGVYYIEQNGEYVVATGEYDENAEYFLGEYSTDDEYEEHNSSEYEIFDGEKYAYADFIGPDRYAYTYRLIELNDSTYIPNTYYFEDSNGLYVLDNSVDYTRGRIYYERTTTVDPLKLDYVRDSKYYKNKKYYLWETIWNSLTRYSRLSDVYQKNTFYYKDGQGNYWLSQDDEPRSDVTYFTFIPDNAILLSNIVEPYHYNGVYIPGKFLYAYETVDDGHGGRKPNYKIDMALNATPGRIYYALDNSTQTTIDNQVYHKIVTFDRIDFTGNEHLYTKNLYWVWIGQGSEDNRTQDESEYALSTEAYNSQVKYYVKNETLKLITNDYYQVREDNPLLLIQFHENEFFLKDNNGNFKVLTQLSNVQDLTGDIYALRKNTDHGNESNGGTYILNPSDYQNSAVSAMIYQNQFYEAGKFHYLANYNPEAEIDYSDLILDTYPTKTHGEDYYTIGSTGPEITQKFFEPFEYYKKENDEYVLITEDITSQEDLPNKIYTRDALYVIEDTAHIYKKGALWSSYATRVPASVTLGTREEYWGLEPFVDFARNINTMHGMLLKVKQMLDYENEETRDIRTVQGALNLLEDKLAQFSEWKPGELLIVDDYGRLHSATNIRNNWIDVHVNSQTFGPTIEIAHKFNRGTDVTNSTVDLTNTALSSAKPIVDSMGHVVAWETTNYSLPGGFGSVGADSGSAIAAASPNDAFTITGDGNWISTTSVSDNLGKKISIAHSNPVTDGAVAVGPVNSQSPGFGQSFSIPAFAIDTMGHVATTGNTSVTLPSLSITSGNNSINNSLLTSISVEGGTFTTTSIAPVSLLLTGYSAGSVTTDIAATDTLGTALSKLEAKIANSASAVYTYTTEDPDTAGAAARAAFWQNYDSLHTGLTIVDIQNIPYTYVYISDIYNGALPPVTEEDQTLYESRKALLYEMREHELVAPDPFDDTVQYLISVANYDQYVNNYIYSATEQQYLAEGRNYQPTIITTHTVTFEDVVLRLMDLEDRVAELENV